jgi:hypothetical protein
VLESVYSRREETFKREKGYSAGREARRHLYRDGFPPPLLAAPSKVRHLEFDPTDSKEHSRSFGDIDSVIVEFNRPKN